MLKYVTRLQLGMTETVLNKAETDLFQSELLISPHLKPYKMEL